MDGCSKDAGVRTTVEQNILAIDVAGMHTAQISAGVAQLIGAAKAVGRVLGQPGRDGLLGRDALACGLRRKVARQTCRIKGARQEVVDRSSCMGISTTLLDKAGLSLTDATLSVMV